MNKTDNITLLRGESKSKMTVAELRGRQSWTLDQKIDHSLGTIEAFVNRMGGEDKVYISFSGGKDSTVLFHLARRIYPNILGVFCNTGNEYPDIIKFVRQTQSEGANIHIIRPKMTPREVWEIYGFPLVSKQVSERVHNVRYNPNSKIAAKCMGNGFFSIPQKWRFLNTETFETSDMCCDKLKKEPMHKFEKETGRSPIIGVMASESLQRERKYLYDGGCNVFSENGRNYSFPLAIWTEKDIWQYINTFNLPIADIYNKGLE